MVFGERALEVGQMSLSDKMWDDSGKGDWQVNVKDVREAVKRLKEEFKKSFGLATEWVNEENNRILNEIFGEKLT